MVTVSDIPIFLCWNGGKKMELRFKADLFSWLGKSRRRNSEPFAGGIPNIPDT